MNKLKNLVLVVSLVLANWAVGKDLSKFSSYDELWKECYSGKQGQDDNLCSKADEYALKLCSNGDLRACNSLGVDVEWGYLDPSFVPAAKTALEQACNKGHMDSCGYVGSAYYNGMGIKKDLKKAKALYEKSCNGNAGNGCDGLALLYEHGEAGLKQNLSQALKLYEKACKLDDVSACQYLSDLYKEGKKVKKDMNKSYKYQKRVCDLGGFQAGECSAEEKKFLEKYK